MSSNRNVNNTGKPKLFSPSVLRVETKYAPPIQVKLSTLSDTNFESTSSFRYDDPGTGVKSTQEIPLDWSRFENHTFFNSAQSKVNIAFDKIINEYPFDGNQKEVEAFEDSLTGYEDYVYDQFPKNRGFLLFSGTSATENPAGGYAARLGTYIKVFDSAGSQFPDFSRKNNGAPVIEFGTNPFSFEFFFRPPEKANSHNVILQKRDSADKSVSLLLYENALTKTADLIFSVNSGSAKLVTSASIEKGKFSHICATYDRDVTNKLLLYVSESLVSTSSRSFEFDTLSFGRPPLYIGSGSSISIPSYFDLGGSEITTVTPATTLSGAIDELRIFHAPRTVEQQKSEGRKDIYASDDLKLYFKFNEPSGSFNIPNVILDSSENSLHSRVSNFSLSLRNTGSYSNPMTSENLKRCPILFPSYAPVGNLNTVLLSSASLYDDENPNLITKMIPVHYLLEGQAKQGLSTQEGQIGDIVTANSIPGSAKIGAAQYMTAFLLIWAKFFDEIKIFVDHFSDILHPSYDDNETVASKFLPFVANYYGIHIPAIFPDTNPKQFIEGENIQDGYSRSQKSLAYVQSEIWKRILINLNEIVRSKGTVHSVTSLIRAIGINPNSLMLIREYGGPTKRSLTGLRQTNTEVATSIDFSGSLASTAGAVISAQGFSSKMPHIISSYLSASRVEVGFPPIAGNFVDKSRYPPHGISGFRRDGFLTSGSFTYEATYQFQKNIKNHAISQSLARLHVTGTDAPANTHGVLVNLMVVSGTENSLTSSGSTLKLFVNNNKKTDNQPKTLELVLTGVHIFDGNLWNVSFGRERSDQKKITDANYYLANRISAVKSSSYFLRCARHSFGEIKELYTTASFYNSLYGNNNQFQFWSIEQNVSGAFIVIGSQSLETSGDRYLNSTTKAPNAARVTKFDGQVSQIRFWSKALEENNWLEHVRNFKSLGVSDPMVHFNFDKQPTGSFERLRVDLSTDQPITASKLRSSVSFSESTGEIVLTDFSQNSLFATGSGFEPNKIVIVPETFYYSQLSPKFDMSQTDNKIRVRSYETARLVHENSYATSTPSFEVLRSEEPNDDTRFSIEFSAVKALDDDMMKLFGTLEFFDSALGRPNLLFDDFYPDVDQLRKIYFKRLTGKPDYQVLFNMFKWFNTTFSSLIDQLIPRKTKFLGVNFVIESHVLERNRFRYLFDDIYLKALERDTDRGNLLLSQIVGTMRKF